MALVRYNQDLLPAFSSMFDNIFGRDLMEPFMRPDATVPAVNIKETEKEFLVEVAAPGMKKEDFHIEIENHRLKISSKKEQTKEEKDEEGKYTRREFRFMSFQRAFELPENIDADKIKAIYKDGILVLNVPKKEMTVKKAKTIQIG
jgi:HSP20 family protein